MRDRTAQTLGVQTLDLEPYILDQKFVAPKAAKMDLFLGGRLESILQLIAKELEQSDIFEWERNFTD